MAVESIPTDLPSGKAPILPNDQATIRLILSSGWKFATTTDMGKFKEYLSRAEAHYRLPDANHEEIRAGIHNPNLRPLLMAALGVASCAENVREIVMAARAEVDREEAGRLLDLAERQSWACADDADRLAVGIGKLALDMAE